MPLFIVDLQDSWHLHDKMLHLPRKTPGEKNGGFQHIRTICVKMGIFSEKQCWTFWNHHLFKCFTFQLSLGVLHQNSSLGVVNCPPRTMPPPRPQTGAAQGALTTPSQPISASSWDVLTSYGMFSSHVGVERKELGKAKQETKTPQSHPKQNPLR